MKLIFSLLAASALLSPAQSRAAETAHATISCSSVQFQRGNDANGFYYLSLTSLSGGINGELAPDFFASGYTHSAYLSMEDELFGETLAGQLVLDIPDAQDANGDGFEDFFQVSQGVSNRPSSGACNLNIYGSSSVAATWNRPAGLSYGNCILKMTLMGQPVSFSHSFQILEYRGPLVYLPGTTNVNGTVSLTQTDNTNATLNGDVQFVKSSTDRFNALTTQAGTWTNESQQEVSFLSHSLSRDPAWPTNYYGFIEMVDNSNPGAFYPYGLWLLSIDDLNDSNTNSIPDLSDDPGSKAPPRTPRLELNRLDTGLTLTIHGDVGYTHEIEALTDLSTSNWQTKASVTLTNDPQILQLPLPEGSVSFWRARAK